MAFSRPYEKIAAFQKDIRADVHPLLRKIRNRTTVGLKGRGLVEEGF
ncbi:MAG: hypothetical protein N3B10_09590 [Armatimonadetes bacterium]|nr:hypothetical protein [Armatimonadota bacterium]